MRTAAGSYTPVGPAPYVVRGNAVGAVLVSLFMVALFVVGPVVGLLAMDGVSTRIVIAVAGGVVITAVVGAVLLYLEIFTVGDLAGVRLAIGRAGIYRCERPVERIVWARVAEVVLSEVYRGSHEGGEPWTSRMETRLTDRARTAAERGPVRLLDYVDHDAVRAAIERHAPSVPCPTGVRSGTEWCWRS